jgi:hypothetical protein
MWSAEENKNEPGENFIEDEEVANRVVKQTHDMLSNSRALPLNSKEEGKSTKHSNYFSMPHRLNVPSEGIDAASRGANSK